MSVMVPGCLRVGHPAGDWGKIFGGGGQVELPFSSFPFLLSAAFSLLLSPFIPISSPSSISHRGFISCDSLKPIISSPPTSIPN